MMYNLLLHNHYIVEKRLEGRNAQAYALVGGGVMGRRYVSLKHPVDTLYRRRVSLCTEMLYPHFLL